MGQISMKLAGAVGCVLLLCGPASADPVKGGTAANGRSDLSRPTAAAGIPNVEAMMSVIDKMFPPQPDPDPARLALARTSVQAMWPDGAYGQMMSGFVGNIFNGVMQMKNSDLAAVAGKKTSKDAAGTVPDTTLHDKIAAKDPYFDQRAQAIRAVMDEEFGKISKIIDPRMREGLARSMARRFDARQLQDINGFFATPSGRALAADYLQLWFQPDTLRSMMSAVPELITLMPDAMQKVKAADDRFPKPHPPATKGAKS